MATPNYGYEKRQRELAKKQKKEEKLRAKAQRKADDPHGEHLGDGEADSSDEAAPDQPAGPAGA